MGVTLKQIKELRSRTGVGIHQVKEALEKSDGDVDKAILYMRQQGQIKAASRAGRSASNGFIGSYIHNDGRIGVLIELNSETDFASRSDRFRELAHNIAVHIAAASPQYVNIDDIPEDIITEEKKVYEKDLKGKPDNVKEKIIEGKMQKFYEEVVLMEQKYLKDDSKRIKDIMDDAIAAVGEKIELGKFTRIQIAGASLSCGLD